MAGMLMSRFRNVLLGLTLTAILAPAFAGAQERAVVYKEIDVASDGTTLLRLEFDSGAPLEISLRDGTVLIDEEPVGVFEAGDPLEAAWRSLLGEAVVLEDGPLAQMLRQWFPPETLEGDRMELAARIDEALEASLSSPTTSRGGPSVSLSVGEDGQGALLQALLGQAGRLGLLQNVLEELGSDVQLYVDQDVEVDEDEVVEGTLVVIQGDAEIDGTVDGDVVVVDGTLQLLSEGRILGDVRLADADIEYDGGTVEGSVVDLLEGERDLEAELRDELREELRHELTSEIRRTVRREDRGGFNPFGGLFRGIGGLIQNAFSILILGLIGMGLVAFAGENLDAVAETARRNPGRAAAVGVAGTFLLVPVWVLGAVALAVSIVGIPVMIAWLPLFPLAAAAAGLLGYLAVARNVGEWLADSGYRHTDWIRKSSPVYLIFGGLVGLTAFFIAANVLSVVPFVGFLRGLLSFAGMLVTLAAALVGFGAVLLTRAGRRREYYPADFDEAWDRAMDAEIELDEDVNGADSEPSDGNGTNEGNGDA
jgi:hypothetical protein